MSLLPTLSRGSAFDVGVLAANLAWVPAIAGTFGAGGPAAGALQVAAWGALSLGALLKRVPLQARLARRAAEAPSDGPGSASPASAGPLVAAFVLLVMLWGLGAALLLAGGEALAGEGGASGPPWAALAGVGLGWLPAALFAAALVAPGGGRTSAWRARPGCELAADLLLGFGAVVSLAWWESGFAPELAAIGPVPWPLGLLAVGLVTVPFAIFYLAPRLLFLVEDWRSPHAWGGAALAMLPLAWRMVL